MAARRRKPRMLTPEQELEAIEAYAAQLRVLIKAKRRYSPEAVHSHRRRLGITAAQYGSLINVQMGTIYGWEQGRFGPKPDQLLRWVALTKMSDKAALVPLKLEEVRQFSARQIKAERRRLGLSQERYGALIDADQAVVSAWERGIASPARESLLKLEAIWGVSRSKTRRMLERGKVVRVTAPPRRRRMSVKPPKPTRQWPLDPERALRAIETRADELRLLVETRKQFSPDAVRSHRQSLGLSAARYGELLGVHMQCVYGWEHGRFRPKPELLKRWIAVTRMNKLQARERLGIEE